MVLSAAYLVLVQIATPSTNAQALGASAAVNNDYSPSSVGAAETLGIEAHLFASVGVSHNFDQRDVRQPNTARVFDVHNDSFRVDVAELVLENKAEAVGDAGLRLDLTYGSSIPATVAGSDFDVQQAYVSYVAPVGSGLTVDAGTFVTHVGAELIEGFDGYNENYTRSILFGYAIPFAHTGVRASYALNEAVSLMALVANGWTHNQLDNNRSKSVGLQLAAAPSAGTRVLLSYLGGPEQEQDNTRTRHLMDGVATLRATRRIAFTVNVDYGREQTATDPTVWWGVAGIACVSLTDRLSVAARGEYYDDRRGGFSGLNSRVVEATLTPSWTLSDTFVLRADVRVDHALDKALFGPTRRQRKTQTTIAANALFAY